MIRTHVSRFSKEGMSATATIAVAITLALLTTCTNASSSIGTSGSVSVEQKLINQQNALSQQNRKAFASKTKQDLIYSISKNTIDTNSRNVSQKTNNHKRTEKHIIPRQELTISSIINIFSSNNSNSKRLSTIVSTVWFTKIPKIVRYLISGNIGNVAVYGCEQFIYHIVLHGGEDGRLPLLLLPPHLLPHRDTISFFIGYLMAVPVQHISHALLVFGISTIDTMEKYITTLIGMYSAMITSCIGSTLLNAALLKYTKIPKGGAFLIVVFSFAFLNFFVIGWIVSNSNNKSNNTIDNKQSSTIQQEPEESSFYNDEVVVNF